MPSHHNVYEYSQEKDSCGIEFAQCLANKAVEKASVKGDGPEVAMNRSYVDVLHIERLLYYQRHSLSGLDQHERSDWRATAPDILR